MFDIELMRRASVVAAMSEAELEAARSYREALESAGEALEQLEAADQPDASLTDEQVASLISEEAKLLVIGFEVSGRSYYERRYINPMWPKGQSGITIGIGYDVGYHPVSEIKKHWDGLIADADIGALCRVAGAKGTAARDRVGEVSHISVPWDAAIKAYERSTMPKYGRLVLRAFPNSGDLHGHCFGALFSLVFNRGSGMKDNPAGSNNRLEMRQIREAMGLGERDNVPALIRKMKRIWANDGLDGLLKRRDAEALLFERGLDLASRQIVVATAPAAGGSLEAAGGNLEAARAQAVLEALDGDGHAYREMDEREGALEAASDWDSVVWSADEASPDYSHITDRSLKGTTFELGARALELLIAANNFEPTREHGRIVFGLRGCDLVAGKDDPTSVPRQENVAALVLRDKRPNHKNFGCVIGVYDTTTGRLSGFASSTVPNRKAVATYHANQSSGNMMPTGCYRFEVGWHLASKPDRKIPGCLIENGRQKAVLRSVNNLSYDVKDTWENHQLHGDNLHPAKSEASAEFSSWGCLVVKGNYEADGDRSRGTHTGEWARFRQALGLAPKGTGDHKKEFDVVLLSGLEAAIAAKLVATETDTNEAEVGRLLGRLRQGSRGPRVKRLQKGLGLKETGVFDPKLAKTLADRQRSELGKGDGVYAPATDKHFGFEVFAPIEAVVAAVTLPAGGSSLESTFSLEAVQAKERDTRIAELEYEIGLYAEAARRDGSGAGGNLEAAQLEVSFAGLRSMGASVVETLEQRLRQYICVEGGAVQLAGATGVGERVNRIGKAGVGYLRDVLVNLLGTMTVFVPRSVLEKVVDLLIEKLVTPSLGVPGRMVNDQVEVTAQWLCQRWAERDRAAAAGPAPAAPVVTSGGDSPLPGPAMAAMAAGAGEGLAKSIEALKPLLKETPVNHAKVAPYLEDIHNALGDPRVNVSETDARTLLRSLRGAKMFGELAWISDRLLTRDPSLFGVAATLYAQGLVDKGQILAGIEMLQAAQEYGLMSDAEKSEAAGILGRAFKQIYVNHVRTPADAREHGTRYKAALDRSVSAYLSAFDPAQPAVNFWHGINYVALLIRARRDGIALDGTHPDPVRLAEQIFATLEPKAKAGDDFWLLATLGEAALAAGDLDKAAHYYGRFAQHPSADAFAINSAARQLAEVWQISAATDGPGAILIGLKSAQAQKPGGFVTLSSEDRRTLAHAQSTSLQQHFETKVAGGGFVNFGLLRSIVQCGCSVAAIQKQVGHGWNNHGTGFLIDGATFAGLAKDKSYVLTNAHVLWDIEQAQAQGLGYEDNAATPATARVVFEHLDAAGAPERFAVARVVWQSPSSLHDACLIELDRAVKGIAALPLADSKDQLALADQSGKGGTKLTVLGHPQGGPLSVAFLGDLSNMRATLVDKGPRKATGEPTYLHYRTPTEPGNSGSPVFDADTWKVVALHHAGYPESTGRPRLAGKDGTNFANEGIWIESIRVALREAMSPAAKPATAQAPAAQGTAGAARPAEAAKPATASPVATAAAPPRRKPWWA